MSGIPHFLENRLKVRCEVVRPFEQSLPLFIPRKRFKHLLDYGHTSLKSPYGVLQFSQEINGIAYSLRMATAFNV
jgi:hypothetical protein